MKIEDMEWLFGPEEPELPKTEEELEQMLMLAIYQKEIERKKLAAQLVMAQGEACSEEKLMAVLRGDYQEFTVYMEELEKGMADCGEYYVSRTKNGVQVEVPWQDGMVAEVFADDDQDGQLAIGREVCRTRENIIFELLVEPVEWLQIFVYTHLVEQETEWQREISH